RVHVSAPLTSGRRHTIEGDAAIHIARVLRLEPGDALTMFDGRGGEYAARIEAIRKGAVMVAVEARSAASRESPLALTLVQGVSRGKRLHWQGIAIAACEQSGRHRIPGVDEPLTLAGFLGKAAGQETRVLLSPAG